MHVPGFFTTEEYSIVFGHHIFAFCSSVDAHLGGFYSPSNVNRVAINMAEQVPGKNDVKSFIHMPWSFIAGSYDRFVSCFSEFSTPISRIFYLKKET